MSAPPLLERLLAETVRFGPVAVQRRTAYRLALDAGLPPAGADHFAFGTPTIAAEPLGLAGARAAIAAVEGDDQPSAPKSANASGPA